MGYVVTLLCMTKAQINSSISHLGLTLHGKRGDGCYYFLNSDGSQAGESVWIGSMSHLSKKQWLEEAESAVGLSDWNKSFKPLS